MFVNIIEFPAVKKGKDEEFRKWFEWSNTVYEKFDGFISRRLLKPTKGKKKYVAIVEHETEETFMKMHLSDKRQKTWAKVEPLLNGGPKPHFYEVMIVPEKKKKENLIFGTHRTQSSPSWCTHVMNAIFLLMIEVCLTIVETQV